MQQVSIIIAVLFAGVALALGFGCEGGGAQRTQDHQTDGATMANTSTLQVTTPADHEITFTRDFDVPHERVFEALTEPELIRRWLLGPPGWSMVVCEVDLTEGGNYRYVWRNDEDGTEMGMGGTYREVDAPRRLVHTEAFDQPWYPGEAVITATLTEHDGRTTFTGTIRYESQEARDMALASGMTDGIEASYGRLESVLLATDPQ